MKAASERVPVTRRLLRSVYHCLQRGRCLLLRHRMKTVAVRHQGVLASASICTRCPYVDYASVQTRRWNRNVRRKAARELARRVIR